MLQSFLLMRLSVVRPIETRKFIAVSRQVSALPVKYGAAAASCAACH
jgi:hypothetical protein